jgi:hypothetical protein
MPQLVDLLPLVVYRDKVLARLSKCVHKNITTTLSDSLCAGVLLKLSHLYLRIRMYAELPVILKNAATKKVNKARNNRKLAKLQHL